MNEPFIVIPKGISLEEKVQLLKQNSEKASEIRGEIQQMKTASIPFKSALTKSEKINGNNQDLYQIDEKLEDIYSKICFLEGLNREDLMKKMKDVLKDYYSISSINRLKLKLYQDIILYAKLALEEHTDIDDIKAFILDLRVKLELLDEMEDKEEIAQISGDENQLFFLESKVGNVVALESLTKNIPLEYYDGFKTLFDSILNGSFKGFKKLRNGLYEVKDFKIRVLFGILEKGKYLILDAFMKKEDTSEYYKSLINNRLAQYIRTKSYYLEQIQDEDVVAKHKQYLEMVFSLFDKKNEIEGMKR